MGTRNLTMVIDQEGEKKVAQYGQWDGYPSRVGVGVLKFLRNKGLFEKFKSNLSKVRFLDSEGRDKEFAESYDTNAPSWSSDPDKRTDEQIKWFESYITRDLAEIVLTNIALSTDDEVILMDRENTARKGGSVEYSYVINLKENTLSVYGTLDEPAFKVYSLNDLPTDEMFIAELEGDEDEK